MHFPRYLAAVVALQFVALALCLAQTASKNPIDEQIRQADALQEKGSIQDARKIYESVLQTLGGGKPSRQLGHVLNGLSSVAAAEGNYQPAIDFAQRADEVYHKLGYAAGEAFALNSRGIAEQQVGRYPAAQASFREALGFSRSVHDFETEVRTLNNLGNAYYFPGNYLEVLRAYEDALQIVERHSTEPWSDYWRQIIKINEATLYQRLGRYQNALQIYKQVGTSSKSLSASDQAHLLMNLGVLYRRLGDPWKALDSYRSALDLYSKQHDAGEEIQVLENIGIVYALGQNDLGKAQQMFERSLARAAETNNERQQMQGHLYLGEILLRKGNLKTGRDEYERALAQARKLDTREEQWKALYGRGRTEELSGEVGRAEADYREAIAIIEMSRAQLQLSALRAEFLADKRDVYDAVISLLLRKKDVKEAFSFLERSRARTFQDRLASSGSGQRIPAAAPSLDEVRGYLDNASVLLEYWVSGDQIALIWCTHESYGMAQRELSAADLKDVRAYLKAVPDNLGADWRRQSNILGQVIPSALPASSGLHRVLIVPDGWLSSVPFDLLPAGDGSKALLIERFSISYLPTAALLRRVKPQGGGLRMPWMRQLVAFGDPTVQASQPTGDGLEAAAGLAPLPYSAAEIGSIAGMAHGKAELFLKSLDLKRTFIAVKANSAPLLHVSTHAFADADSPEGSRILFSPENAQASPDYVFLRELYDLDLSGVNLATLSACNTERGQMIRGEGVQAFSRALLFAGSRSALTTLWRVDDQPTSEFMKQFYYYVLEQHRPKGEALRYAKLKFLRSGTPLENPAHWAAFVLNGDALDALPVFVSWSQIAGATSVAVAVILVFSAAFRRQSRQGRRVHRIHSS
ncbi:MAG TPA: CHAT domain-containing tetratricopeptide repeat protein [Terriglobales bacterium]|nr:CHAT domain-containing tetratricopeptide repeat protein [Terriglobales bacterium]